MNEALPEEIVITDFTVDLETMSTAPNAAIVGIGLAGFNIETGDIYPLLNVAVDLTSSMERGLTVDGGTVSWWLNQSKDAQEFLLTERQMLQEAIFMVQDHMRSENVPVDADGKSNARVWGNGIAADNVWLREAFKACGVPVPWSFRNDRDVRTIRDLATSFGCEDFKETLEFEGTVHCALDDAVHQAKYVCSYYKFLRELKGGSL